MRNVQKLVPDSPVKVGRKTRIIGLTGGTGSGKSEVAEVFARHDIPIVNADRIGHEMLQPGGAAVQDVVRAFGEEIMTDGVIDRKKLGAIVFADPDKLRQLNGIVHPLIQAEVERRCIARAEAGHGLIIIDAALLAEDGKRGAFLDGLIVVHCLQDVRIRRLVEQRGFTRDEALQRVRAQTPPECKLPIADWVIENNGSLAELQAKAEQVVKELKDESGQHSKVSTMS